MDTRPFHPHSFEEADRTGNAELYRQSKSANIDCKNAINSIIDKNYDGYRLGKDLAKQIISKFGFDRTAYVLANSVQLKDSDGRISSDNKEWAKSIFVPEEEHARFEYLVEKHSGLLDLFVNQYRREYKALNLWDTSQVILPQDLDFKNKVMVLKPEILNEQHKTRDEQLFFAVGGFGCDSQGVHKKVMGEFLIDGERTSYYRYQFLGEAKPEFLPHWAKEKLAVKDRAKEKTSVLEQLKANNEQVKQHKPVPAKEKKQDKGER